jgi:hypothetical protein
MVRKLNRPIRPLPVIREKLTAENISDYASVFQLKATEVILGIFNGRPVRVDIMNKHTLLGASTGGAKSYLIHSILIQLFGKGSRFMDNVDVFIADLKGHPSDMFQLWQPILTGYARRSDTGDITSIIDMLNYIDHQLQRDINKRILLIVEEASILTADKAGDELLSRIASQLRINGSLLATIQHPHHRKMQTFIKHNIERRIAGVCLNVSQAEVILEHRPKDYEVPEKPGQYLLREPGKRNIIKLESMCPNLPEEIETIVRNGVNILAEKDERLKIFRDVCQNKTRGAAITGVQTLAKDFTWLNNAQFRLLVAYRNFVNAKIFTPPQAKGSRNHLAVNFEEGFSMLKQYIDEGNWKEEPETMLPEGEKK